MTTENEPVDLERLLRIAAGQDDPGPTPKPATAEDISAALRALKPPPEGEYR